MRCSLAIFRNSLMDAAPAPEFSRIIRLNEVGDGAREHKIQANEAERLALARRFGLLGLGALDATLTIVPQEDNWRVSGVLVAKVTQSCVASAQPVTTSLNLPFAVRYVRESNESMADDLELQDGDCDELLLDGEWIDLGETVAQSLYLGLDPYPRAPDAESHLRALGVISEDEAGPFAALAGLKGKLKQ